MKKNRPGVKLSVLCSPQVVASLEAIVFGETGTLGIRRWTAARHILAREATQVQTAWGPIEGKLSRQPNGAIHFSPEYEACRRVAEEYRLSFREVYAAAERAYKS